MDIEDIETRELPIITIITILYAACYGGLGWREG